MLYIYTSYIYIVKVSYATQLLSLQELRTLFVCSALQAQGLLIHNVDKHHELLYKQVLQARVV